MKQKKSIGGLEFLKSFMIGLSVIIVLAFALVIMNSNLQTSLVTSGSVVNETGYINATGYTLAVSSTLNKFASPSIVYIANRTDSTTIANANATLVGNVVYNNSAYSYNNATITYSYTYVPNKDADNIIGNYSSGISSLSTSVSTWITLAGLVVVIGIIAIVIFLVSRFGGRNEEE